MSITKKEIIFNNKENAYRKRIEKKYIQTKFSVIIDKKI